jgi:hypothetical protein
MLLSDLSPEDSFRLVGVARAGVYICYFDLDSRPNGKFRIRFYDDSPEEAANKFKPARPLRYMSPAGVAPGLYLAPWLDWKSVAVVNTALYSTEGEFSAAKACSVGLPFLGLSGTWSFKSRNARAFELLREFDEFTLRDREMPIVYDSDLSTKPQVLASQHAYASELAKRGARPKSIILPTLPGQAKSGIDEYLNALGVDEFKALPVVEFDEIAQLFKLSEQYNYDRGVHAVLRLSDFSLCNEGDFSRDERNKRIIVPRADGKGTHDLCAPLLWLKWPNRPDVSGIVYEPALPTGRLEDGRFNVHRKDVEPRPGDRIHLWHRLMRELLPDEERRAQFESWCFYPVQHPGTKLYSIPLLWSETEGSGKSIAGELLLRMYGVNGFELNDPDRLFDNFNSWGERRQFVLVNEIHTGDARKRINRLKNLATSETIEINIKNKPHYSIRDVVNYLTTSNYPDALYMTNKSRRFLVLHVTEARLEERFTEELHEWKLDTAGSELLYYGLRYRIAESFKPRRPAPWSADNAEMAAESASALERYCQQIVGTDRCPSSSAVEGVSVYATQDLFTGSDIAALYNMDHREHANSVSAGRALAKAGAKPLGKQGRIKVNGTPERIYATGDFEHYQRVSAENPAQIADAYLSQRADTKRRHAEICEAWSSRSKY